MDDVETSNLLGALIEVHNRAVGEDDDSPLSKSEHDAWVAGTKVIRAWIAGHGVNSKALRAELLYWALRGAEK